MSYKVIFLIIKNVNNQRLIAGEQIIVQRSIALALEGIEGTITPVVIKQDGHLLNRKFNGETVWREQFIGEVPVKSKLWILF